ncbi:MULTISPECIES: heme exporter protein CcmD [Pectobacterium]|uniref:Heme exporter protein D n=1 Tax=Pectobacterium carotovorum subsp. carotovorum (strain PC1) TaxID=561230 RepID=C6DK69_PECCP|nr:MULTISPECIES: heme exporter protein CcmD [Pectobacterium]ACT13452.1 heme exporter protein CcmD [Pectobacterium carotovorum subsp. carotovorum PC1]MBA0204622.1 heme exporter protein CcmD [Pectobacterium aroidearum]MBG0751789.1 Heme exporter protein D [Pectobacterium carotovorum subsp. carotovorum PCCS1]QPI41408.1 heme exporter protein CcmD [Pectobacterium aroidearum]UUE56062.1 heme exporter protein CcmD [Pectobacterium aroidearum]
MNIAFTSWQDFFAMGGYAFYVWLAVVLTLLPLSALVGQTLWHRRTLMNDIRRQQAREQRKSTARQSKAVEVTP